MMHPPPEAFLQATEQRRSELERSEPSTAFRVLGSAVAVLLTLGVHVGLYFALTSRTAKPSAPQDMPAAIMIDMSPEPTVAKSEVDNSMDGPAAPDSQEAQPDTPDEPPPPPPPAAEAVLEAPPPPPQVVPQAVLAPKVPQEVRPPEPRTPEKPPEKPRLREKPRPREKPVEKRHVDEKPRPSAASRSGGGPKSDRQNADRTAAAAAGSAVSQASRATWQNEMRARIVRSKRYPSAATGAVGVAVVSVTFAADGSVAGTRLIASSGNAALDAEAVAVMYRAAPFPPPPGGRATTLTIPLNFSRR